MQFEGDEGFPDSGNTFDNLNQFAPRVGLAWDPRGDNVQTIRAAAGVYYDSPKLWQYGRHPLNAPFGNTIQVNQPASINDPWAAYPGGNPFPTPFPPPSDIQFPTLGTYVTMPLDLEPMRVTQWNVSYQLQFASSWMALGVVPRQPHRQHLDRHGAESRRSTSRATRRRPTRTRAAC